MEKAVPERGLNGVSGASRVTAASKGVTGPSRAPSISSGGGGAGGASAFSRRPSDTASSTPATAL